MMSNAVAQPSLRLPPGKPKAPAKAKIARADLLQWRKMGLSWPQQAKLAGVSRSTIARLWAEIEGGPPTASVAVETEPPEPTDPRERAIAALNRALRSDDGRAVTAAKALLDELRRETQVATYADLEMRRARALVREQARRLGVALRALILAGDRELARLYKRAAATTAGAEDRAALVAWVNAHPDVLAQLEVSTPPPTKLELEALAVLEAAS